MGTLSFLFPCLLFLWGVRGEVSDNFNNCKQFFFRGTPVSGLIALPTPEDDTTGLVNYEKCLSAYNATSPAHICQVYENNYYFATLYDRGRRIPLYSAYLVDIKDTPRSVRDRLAVRREKIVNYEPQLVHDSLPRKQMNKKDLEREILRYSTDNKCEQFFEQYRNTYKLAWSQALHDHFNTDKKVIKYDRGHLNPAGAHDKDTASFKATMTHTNVAPQDAKINNGVWNVYEEKMRDVLRKGCSKMYAVTGVVPTKEEWIVVEKKKRVNVPSHYWSAYCCTDNNDKPIRSGGALCVNLNVPKYPEVTEYNTVEQLEIKLKGLLNLDNNFSIFNGCVPRETNVYDYYDDDEGSAEY